MSKISILICIIIISCQPNVVKSPATPLEKKIENATLLMYKIYSICSTSILKKSTGKIDTLEKDIDFLCLPLNVYDVEVQNDTTIITLFFKPVDGYQIEDPKCDFAYGIGFVGPDDECDFIEFGDNYNSMEIERYKKARPKMDSFFYEKIKRLNCVNNTLLDILNAKR